MVIFLEERFFIHAVHYQSSVRIIWDTVDAETGRGKKKKKKVEKWEKVRKSEPGRNEEERLLVTKRLFLSILWSSPLKGTHTEDSSWPEDVKNVQIHLLAHFVLLFFQCDSVWQNRVHVERSKARWIQRSINPRFDGPKVLWIQGSIDPRFNGPRGRQSQGLIDPRFDGSKDQ